MKTRTVTTKSNARTPRRQGSAFFWRPGSLAFLGCSKGLTFQSDGEILPDLIDGHALLRHLIALADGDGLVLHGVAVDGDAERRADFVHAGVSLADVLLGVVFGGVVLA